MTADQPRPQPVRLTQVGAKTMLQLKSQEINIDSIHPVRFLQQHFPNWTLQKIAEEMGYSDSAVRQWSSGHRNFSPRAQRDAYRVYEKYYA